MMNEGFSVFHNFLWLLDGRPNCLRYEGARILRRPVNNYSRILLYNNITPRGGMGEEREGE